MPSKKIGGKKVHFKSKEAIRKIRGLQAYPRYSEKEEVKEFYGIQQIEI